MQIDFHHTVTYVLARLAGFPHNEASIISTAAQYVDDSTVSGVIHFHNKAMYQRTSSAHKTIDPINLRNTENYMVWLPFHFLPGNGGYEAGKDPDGYFINKIICRPNSPVAQDMLRAAFRDKGLPRGLHRLGVAMHVYADTWSHQGFAGVLNDVNDVDHIVEPKPSGVFPTGVWEFLSEVITEAIPPTGHGRANVLPDLPFLQWSYENSCGERVTRDNTQFFVDAAEHMYAAMYTYRNPSVSQVPPMLEADLDLIRQSLSGFRAVDEFKRHQCWIDLIASGKFSFGKAQVSYVDRGPGSWKELALGTSQDLEEYQYTPAFLQSDWKRFHDALQAHRMSVLHDILPQYGICAG